MLVPASKTKAPLPSMCRMRTSTAAKAARPRPKKETPWLVRTAEAAARFPPATERHEGKGAHAQKKKKREMASTARPGRFRPDRRRRCPFPFAEPRSHPFMYM